MNANHCERVYMPTVLCNVGSLVSPIRLLHSTIDYLSALLHNNTHTIAGGIRWHKRSDSL